MGRPRRKLGVESLRVPLGSPASVQQLLDTPLTINGQTPNPSMRHVGQDATLTTWPHNGFGEGLVITGAGPAPRIALASPLLGAVDGGASCATGASGDKFWAAAPGREAYGDIGTEDFVFSILQQGSGIATSDRIVDHRGTSGNGWTHFWNSSTQMSFAFVGAGATVTWVVSARPVGAISFNEWYYDASGSMQAYEQGIRLGAAMNVSAVGSMTKAQLLAICGISGATLFETAGVVYLVELRKLAGWLDTHLQDAVAKTRFLRLAGMRALFARGNAEPSSYGSASPCYLSRRLASGVTQLFYMGINWPCFTTLRPSGWASDFVGLLNEPAETNRCLQSLKLNTTPWVRGGTTAIVEATTEVADPEGLYRACKVTGLGTETVNDLYQVLAGFGASVPVSPSFWIKRISTSGVLTVRASGSTGEWTINMSTLPDGWVKIDRASPYKTQGLAWAATAGGGLTKIWSGGAGGSIGFYVWNASVTNVVDIAGSDIITTTGVVTRAASTFIVPSSGNVRLPSGSVRFKFWAPVFTPATRRTLLSINDASVNNRIDIFIHTDGTLHLESAKVGGNSGDIALAGSVCDGAVHTVTCSWRTTSLTLSRDGSASGTDSSADILTSAVATQISVAQDAVGGTNAGPILVSDLRFGA